jgi:P27 family predicted phage terminase small subunit
MRGRKPTPTALKRLHGVEARRINRHEPIPLPGFPPCPSHFTDEQAELWHFAVTNAPPGMVKSLDVGLLEAWCVAYSIHRAATAELSREGVITVPGIKDPDRRVAAPQIGIINRTAALLSRLSSELGFSPTARSRVQVPSPHSLNTADEDPSSESLDDFLLRGERLRARAQAEIAKKH